MKKFTLDEVLFTLLVLAAAAVLFYTFWLSKKRYDEFIFGKFDLGNMTQIVWNTAHGRFMQITDQFGSNIKRFGMSHVDLVLALMAPLFWIYPHPLVLVAAQNVFIVSGTIPIFWYLKDKTKSSPVAFLVGLMYLLYPANGFLLIWSEYHGVTHVAPLFIWMFYLIDKWQYKLPTVKHVLIFWALFVVMLLGKEQVGFMLAMFGLYVLYYNRKLGYAMFLSGMFYSLFCFLILIPSYKDIRAQSFSTFLRLTDQDALSNEATVGDNFFLNRYTYLGTSYSNIASNVVHHPSLLGYAVFDDDKVENMDYLFRPLGYLSILTPLWLIAVPDYLIAILADVKGFLSIENQRVAFMTITQFVSFMVFLAYISKYQIVRKYRIIHIIAVICLGLTFQTSFEADNPLFISTKSLIQNKIIKKVFSAKLKSDIKEDLAIGSIKNSTVPQNSADCYRSMLKLVDQYNPKNYSGPDALGAHTALRETNAMFPAAIDKSDMFISDIFDAKAYRAVKISGNPTGGNQEALRRVISNLNFKHISSCGPLSAFVRGDNTDTFETLDDYIGANPTRPVDLQKNTVSLIGNTVASVSFIKKPFVNGDPHAVYMITKESLALGLDKIGYWKFVDAKTSKEYSFYDYNFWGRDDGWEDKHIGDTFVIHYNMSFIGSHLENGHTYKVFYGIGDKLRSQEIYAFDIDR